MSVRPIDATAVIAQVKTRQKWWSNYDADELLMTLEDAPTLHVREDVRGEWQAFLIFGRGDPRNEWGCSACGTRIRSDIKPIMPFCPWCGADMRKRRQK